MGLSAFFTLWERRSDPAEAIVDHPCEAARPDAGAAAQAAGEEKQQDFLQGKVNDYRENVMS